MYSGTMSFCLGTEVCACLFVCIVHLFTCLFVLFICLYIKNTEVNPHAFYMVGNINDVLATADKLAKQ